MKRRAWLRCWSKWFCTALAVFCVGVAATSGAYSLGWSEIAKDYDTAWLVNISGGKVTFREHRGFGKMGFPMGRGWRGMRHLAWEWGWDERGWRYGVNWVPPLNKDFCTWGFGFSLLYPVLATSLPAMLLWYADRNSRLPAGCPTCGYDRRGLVEGAVCPECGRVAV